jgi:hypothetical protein
VNFFVALPGVGQVVAVFFRGLDNFEDLEEFRRYILQYGKDIFPAVSGIEDIQVVAAVPDLEFLANFRRPMVMPSDLVQYAQSLHGSLPVRGSLY